MLSDVTFSQIARLTQRATTEIPDQRVVDCVTAIRSYVHLLAVFPEREEYRDAIVANLLNLSTLASSRQKTFLAFELDALVVVIRNVS